MWHRSTTGDTLVGGEVQLCRYWTARHWLERRLTAIRQGLLPAGHTVDILLDVSNVGLSMAQCHIAEHAQSGMMFSFDVARRDETHA